MIDYNSIDLVQHLNAECFGIDIIFCCLMTATAPAPEQLNLKVKSQVVSELYRMENRCFLR